MCLLLLILPSVQQVETGEFCDKQDQKTSKLIGGYPLTLAGFTIVRLSMPDKLYTHHADQVLQLVSNEHFFAKDEEEQMEQIKHAYRYS